LHELQDLPPAERLNRSLELSDTRMNAAWRDANAEAYERVAAIYRGRQEVGTDGPDGDRGQRLQFEARAGLDTFDRLAGLRVPVYLCGGRYDGIAPPANMEAIQKQIPGARLELFDGGHLFLVQDRSAWPAILSFLKGEREENR
jgi:3-oxoadipate enol-lactonase